MRKRYTLSMLLFGGLAAAGSARHFQPRLARPEPQLFTITVHHDECMECGDFELDSGQVVVPMAMRERYVQALVNSPRFGRQLDKRNRVLVFCNSTGYRVGNVKVEREQEFDALFLLPGKQREDYLTGNPWDFNRRYRATVEVVGIKWSYLTVRVRKAVRLSDRKD